MGDETVHDVPPVGRVGDNIDALRTRGIAQEEIAHLLQLAVAGRRATVENVRDHYLVARRLKQLGDMAGSASRLLDRG